MTLTVWAPDGAPEIGAGDDLAVILLGVLGPDAVADAEGASRSRPAGDEAAEIVQFRRRGRRSLGHEREDEASETAAREAVALDKGDEPVGSDEPGGRHAASRESSSDRHA